MAGFFGIPVEDQYHLEVMIEAPGFNCTLSPWTQVGHAFILIVLSASYKHVPIQLHF